MRLFKKIALSSLSDFCTSEELKNSDFHFVQNDTFFKQPRILKVKD